MAKKKLNHRNALSYFAMNTSKRNTKPVEALSFFAHKTKKAPKVDPGKFLGFFKYE